MATWLKIESKNFELKKMFYKASSSLPEKVQWKAIYHRLTP